MLNDEWDVDCRVRAQAERRWRLRAQARCAVGLLFACVAPVIQAAQQYEPLVTFPVTDTRAEVTRDLGRDLIVKVTRAVDAQGRHFGWDLSIADRRLRDSPDFFYECLCGHGPMPQDLYAWHFKTDEFPNERLLPVWGYPYEVRVECDACTVAGGDGTEAFFTGGTVKIETRRLAVANHRQLRPSDLRGRGASRRSRP